jgi:hypothetical protein
LVDTHASLPEILAKTLACYPYGQYRFYAPVSPSESLDGLTLVRSRLAEMNYEAVNPKAAIFRQNIGSFIFCDFSPLTGICERMKDESGRMKLILLHPSAFRLPESPDGAWFNFYVAADLSSLIPGILPFQGLHQITGTAEARIDGR